MIPDEEVCAQCGDPMPERVFDWWITMHNMFCSEYCVNSWLAERAQETTS